MLCWIVRAKKDGIAAIDANGVETTLSAGQRGWMPQDEALSLSLSGDVEMLSPDGITALQREKVKPNGVQTKTEGPAETAPEASVKVTEGASAEPVASAEVTDSAQSDAPRPAVSVAPAPPRKGPQLKPLGVK